VVGVDGLRACLAENGYLPSAIPAK
jgi:hypothetical protein